MTAETLGKDFRFIMSTKYQKTGSLFRNLVQQIRAK